ncbi:MAG: tRNA-dihydrouridine synthase [Candidatus Nanoarchaeia archaeon]|nr:tRNA-dihydrouridine synthase [Candidatus Nanoarchaeia archaeon]
MIINGIEIKGKFFLAPMRAINISSFRKLCQIRGCEIVYSQMVDVDEFFEYSNQYGIEKAKKRFVNINDEKIIIQVIGRNVEKTLFLIDSFKNEVIGFDVNAGCPINEYLGKKSGAYFMKDPNYLYKYVSGIREKYKGFLSVKIRSGWDDNSINAIEICKKLKELEVDMICVHPRTKEQAYSGHGDWSLLARIKKEVDIPLTLSGDVFNIYDAYKAFQFSKADFIMLGRAPKVYPSIFKDLTEYFNKENNEVPEFIKGYDKKINNVKEDLLLFFEYYKKYEVKFSIDQIKQYINWFFTDIKKNKLLREINEKDDLDEIIYLIKNKL